MTTVHLTWDSPQIARVTAPATDSGLMTGLIVRQLIEIEQQLSLSSTLKVAVFESDDPDFFLNRFDLDHLADFPGGPAWMNLVTALSEAPYVTIAKIRGRTRGGGNELALALDLRYASKEKAFFGQPEVGAGVVPGGGGTARLPRLVGRDRALEAILGSADYDAVTAERWGWVTRALDDDALDSYVDHVATRLASFDADAIATVKTMLNPATLPAAAELETAYETFDALMRAQMASAAPNPAQQRPSAGTIRTVEMNLGEHLGAVPMPQATHTK